MLEECDKAFNTMVAGGEAVHDDLDDLLERKASLEQRRGTAQFDPWEIQAVRREINDYVRQHPESTSRLDTLDSTGLNRRTKPNCEG